MKSQILFIAATILVLNCSFTLNNKYIKSKITECVNVVSKMNICVTHSLSK